MEHSNPAVNKQTAIPPALLEEIEHNPKVMQPIYAKMLAVNANYVHHMVMSNPNVPLGQRIQVMDILAKLGDAYPKASAPVVGAGERFSVQINYNAPPPAAQPAIVIEAETSDASKV